MSETTTDAVSNGAGIAAMLFFFVVALAVHIFFSYCFKRICEKAGEEPGVLVWIPILQLIPLLKVADLPVWLIILFFIPFVNIILNIFMWVKICQARNKGALAMVLVILLPPIGIPYLAFSA